MNTDRMRRDDGFTLIELLVVILIIGVLAAIAIPAFLSQREKGQDACGKSMIKQMQTAMETYRIDHGNYTGASPDALHDIESTIPGDGGDPCNAGWNPILTGNQSAGTFCNGNAPAANSYCLFVPTPNNQGFRLYKSASGAIVRNCAVPGQGGCPSSGLW